MDRRTGKMGQAGLASLMDQQTALINELNNELARQKDIRRQGPPAQNPLMDVVRNMEARLDETKWPTAMTQKIEDLEAYVKESRPETPVFDSPTLTRTNMELSKKTPKAGGGADALDQLQQKIEGVKSTQVIKPVTMPSRVPAPQMIQELSSSEDEDARRRKKERKRAKREREYKRKLKLDRIERERLAEEEKPVPDPAVLVHIFNPFRLLQWDVPPFEKYQQEVDEMDQKIAMKKREIEVAKKEVDEYNKSQVKFLEREIEEGSLGKSPSRRDFRLETRKSTKKATKISTFKRSDSKLPQSRSRSTSPYKSKSPMKSSLLNSKRKLDKLEDDDSMKAKPSGDVSEV